MSGEAHFAHLPGVSLEWDQSYLADLAATERGAIHGVVRDQAGFASALRRWATRGLPARVRLIDLPPYSPELNPSGQLWDIVKDATSNRVHATIAALRKSMRATRRRYWEDTAAVLRLIGREWILAERNAIRKSQVSV